MLQIETFLLQERTRSRDLKHKFTSELIAGVGVLPEEEQQLLKFKIEEEERLINSIDILVKRWRDRVWYGKIK